MRVRAIAPTLTLPFIAACAAGSSDLTPQGISEALGAAGAAGMHEPREREHDHDRDHATAIEHVLLLSIDGLHAQDLSNFIAGHPDSALAGLVS